MNEMVMRREIIPTLRYIVCLAILMCATTAMAAHVQSGDGLAVMEAESYEAVVPGDTGEFDWVFDTELDGYSQEGYMRSLPEGTNVMSDYARCARLDFDVMITQPGTLYFWARVLAPTSAMNSIHLGDNGVVTADRINIPEINEWIWKNVANNGDRAAVEVSEPGVVTVNCWMRESGVCVDKLLLTSNPDYVPEGEGPAETLAGIGIAKGPFPADEAVDIPRDDTILSWSPGKFAATHNVYFGTDFKDVNDATVPTASGLDANSFDPKRLDFGQTYFWRVDEVNGTPDKTVYTGNVWSFEAEPYSIPIPGAEISVIASSESQNGLSPAERVVDGSGLDDNGILSVQPDTMWFSATPDPDPWIRFDFDAVNKLDTMKVWNANGLAESGVGWGIKGVEILYSKDGETWTVLEGANEFSRAPGAYGYDQYDEIAFSGVTARHVRFNIQSNWGGFLPSYGLSEVQFNAIPTLARTPNPASGSVDIMPNALVTWRAGREADQHTIHLSTDENAVTDGSAPSTTSNAHSLDLGSLAVNLGETYYWRVDEINEAETPSVWTGPVWNLSTADALLVDDFEGYSNVSPDRPFQTWHDGFGYSADDFFPVAYGGNGTGSGAGHDIWSLSSPHYEGSIMEEDIAIAGSSQSLPFYYNTGGVDPQIDRVWAVPQDWTLGGAQTLVVHFFGNPGNTGQLYVEVNKGAKVPYDGPAGAMTKPYWTQWNIDLSSLAGNLQAVTQLSLGVQGGSGVVYIDDILLYKDAPAGASEQVWIEAESAALDDPMQVYTDMADASGGSHIGTENLGNQGDQSDGIASFTFTVQGGTYKVDARVIGSGAGDSFWVRLQSATLNTTPPAANNGWIRWNGIAAGATWLWDDIHNDQDGNITVHFTLAPGEHTLEIGYREDGALLDAIVITDQL